MSKRLTDLRLVDPLLTSIVQGMSNDDANFVADIVFPVVPVQTESGYFAEMTKEHFKSFNTERAIHADSNEAIIPAPSKIAWTLDEHDISVPVDYREEAEAVFSVEQGAAFSVREILRLAREKRVATLLQDNTKYTNSNHTTISTKWDTASGDPLVDINDAIDGVRAISGRRPNGIIFGASAWKTFTTNASVLDRIKYSGLGIVSQETARQLIGVAELNVGDAISASDAGAFSDVWGDNVVLYYKPSAALRPSLYVPSFGYTLQRGGGILIDRYTVNRKVNYVRGTTIETQLFHGNVAGWLLEAVNT